MGATPKSLEGDQFSEEETQQRFEKLVKAALNTRPKPLKDVPRKWSGKQRRQRKKAKKIA